MVSVQINFLTFAEGDSGRIMEEKPGPKVALSRIPVPEEEVSIKADCYRVIYVRHIAEVIPLPVRGRNEWPHRAEIGVVAA